MKPIALPSICAGLLFTLPAWALAPLQLFVDLTPAGKTLRPPPGVYAGPVTIDKPIVLDGGGEVTVDGGGEGTVITVKADGAVLRGLHITASGNAYDAMDAGVKIGADGVVLEGNRIDDVLFGVSIAQGNDNLVRDNEISSKPLVPSLRGEGVRIWYGHDNRIENNRIHQVRDLLLTNASGNRILGNDLRNNRISMEFIFSPDNEIRGNHLAHNDTGIVAIYSDGLTIADNRIEEIGNVGSSALAIKESSQVHITHNAIVHNATGLTANSPIFPENILYLEGNTFSYNSVAMYFYGEKGGHVVHDNDFLENLTDIAVSHDTSAKSNDWRGNRWDRYQGFDRDGDGYGDTPYRLKNYADRLWMDRPPAQFFRGTPVMSLLDFVERLAPFSTPGEILTDRRPRMGRSATTDTK